jgi:hypothetical protein
MAAIDYEGGLGGAAQAASRMPRLQGRPPALPVPRQDAGGASGGLGSLSTLRDVTAARERAQRPGQTAQPGLMQRAGNWIGDQMGLGGPPAGAAVPAPGPVQVESLPPPPGVPVAMVVEPWALAGVPGYAAGGLASVGPRRLRARRIASTGLVHSASPGRADLVGAKLRRGSYVLPADVVSGLGQGNTMAGAKLLQSSLPEAAEMASRGAIDRAMGGMAEPEDELEVRLSGGEFLVGPEQVLAIGEGDVEAGAAALDQLVHAVRGSTRAELARMPPPK